MFTLTVKEAARILLMSPARLRLLLSQGRVAGHKDPFGFWVVHYPFVRTPGRRGPDMRYFPVPRKGRPSKRRKRPAMDATRPVGQ